MSNLLLAVAGAGGFLIGVLCVLLLSRYLERRDAKWIHHE